MRQKIILLFLAVIIFSCGKTKENSEKIVRPVKVTKVVSKSEISKEFAGSVEAVNFVKLAFRVNGQIINMPILEGQRVAKGDLIAEIDTRDLKLQYAADKAAFETALAQLDRNKRLLSQQAISVQEYEISQSSYQKAKSAYELSTNNMSDARLVTPFAGSIEKKLAENFQRVNSGTPIVQLIDTRALQVRFTLPDNNIFLMRGKDLSFEVVFNEYRNHRFKAKLKEYLDASPDGTGIPVTLTIADEAFAKGEYDIKPGFSCVVTLRVRIDSYLDDDTTWIPLTALFSDPQSDQKCVWVVRSDNTVVRRQVDVLSPSGESHVIVSKGLKPGETIVTAGVYMIVEGEKVRII